MPTLGELNRQTVVREFVGRTAELDLLRQALLKICAPPSERARAGIVAVTGWSGFGKTWLLVRFADICERAGAHWLRLDAKHPTAQHGLQTLPAFLAELHQSYLLCSGKRMINSASFQEYERLHATFRRTDEVVSSLRPRRATRGVVNEEGDWWSTFFSQLAPRARTDCSENQVSEAELAEALARGLRLAAGSAPLVVMIDGYDEVIRQHYAIQRLFLERLQTPVLVILAGQRDLEREGLIDNTPGVEMGALFLGPLCPGEVDAYLQSHGVGSQELREHITKATRGVPAAVRLAVDIAGRCSSEDETATCFPASTGVPLTEVVGRYVPAWYQCLGDEVRPLMEAACVLRRFDRATLESLVSPIESRQMTDLVRVPSVQARSDKTYIVHEAIRSHVRQYLVLEQRAEELNRRATEAFTRKADPARSDPARFEDREWCQAVMEWLYHVTQVNVKRGVGVAIEQAADAIWHSRLDVCLGILDATGDAGLLENDQRWVALLRSAMDAISNSSWQDAQSSLEALFQTSPSDGVQRLQQVANDCLGDVLCAQREWAKARDHLIAAAALYQERHEYYKTGATQEQLAMCAKGLRDREDQMTWAGRALKALRKAESRGDRAADVWHRIGRIYLDHFSDLEKAVVAFEHSYQVDPERSAPLYEIASAYEEAEHWAEAVSAYARMAAAFPDLSFVAQASAAFCLARAGAGDDARARLQELESVNFEGQHLEEAWELIGDAYYELHNWNMARAAFERSAEIAPRRLGALIGIAKTHEAVQCWEEAAKGYERAASSAAEQGRDLSACVACCLAHAGHTAEAEARLHVIEREAPNTPKLAEAWGEIAEVYHNRLQDPERALLAYEYSIQLDPSRPGPLHGLARWYEEAKRWEEAAGVHERLASSSPNWAFIAQAQSAYCLARAGQLERVRAKLQELVAMEPHGEQLAGAWERIGYIYSRYLHDPDQALTACERSLAVDSRRPLALLRIARIHEAAKRWEEAAKAYEQAASVSTERSTDLSACVACCLAHAGHIVEAEARLQLIEQKAPTTPNLAEAWEQIGDIYDEQLEDPERALAAYEHSLQLDPKRLNPLLGIAWTHEEAERWEAAADAYARVASLFPNLAFVAEARSIHCLARAGQLERVGGKLQELEGLQSEGELLAEAWERIGDVYREHLQDMEKALASYARSHEADPQRSGPLIKMAHLNEQLGNYSTLAGVYDGLMEALVAETETPTQLRRLAWIHYKRLDLSRAEELCCRVPDGANDEDWLRVMLIHASVAFLLGQEEIARDHLAQIATKGPLDDRYRQEAIHDIRTVAQQLTAAPDVQRLIDWIEILPNDSSKMPG